MGPVPPSIPSIPRRHWLAYLAEAAMDSGELSGREAVRYLTEHLFGAAPNPRVLESAAPYETTLHLLQRLYRPIVEATSRDLVLPEAAMLHVFVDVSLTGHSAVLVVYFPGQNRPHHLLLLDAVKAWELVFADAPSFNRWAQERSQWIADALRAVVGGRAGRTASFPSPHEAAGIPSGS